jgi:hypothetical protein
LIQGQSVRLEFDKEQKDTYGRLLAHIYLRDGTWVNGRMVESGFAHSYTFAPNFKYSDDLLKRERLARSHKLGIWNTREFEILKAAEVGKQNIGQFRVVKGNIDSVDKNMWGFRMDGVSISIPRAHRKWFKAPPELKDGDIVVIRGKIRISSRGKLFVALHSPFDLEITK